MRSRGNRGDPGGGSGGAVGWMPCLLLEGSVVSLVAVPVMVRRLGLGLGSQFRLQIVVPAMYLTPAAMMIVRFADYDNG